MTVPTKYIQNDEINTIDELYRRVGDLARRVEFLENELSRRQWAGQPFEPILANGYAQPADGTERFSVRAMTGGLPHFSGHLDTSAASSGAVAFTLPLGPNDFAIPDDIYHHTAVVSGTSAISAVFKIDHVTGDVSFIWPA